MLDRKEWYQSATRQLMERATNSDNNNKKKNNESGGAKKNNNNNKKKKSDKQLKREAQIRSSELSTSSDKKGVSFAGPSFQATYYSTKFYRRGHLLYSILSDLYKKCKSPRENLFPNINQTTDNQRVVKVASIGGGPGTDAAGLLWFQKDYFNCDNTQFEVVLYDYEPSWKKYTKTLSDLLGPNIEPVTFCLCDVTQSIHDPTCYKNQKVDVSDTDLLLFFYVCHETSNRQYYDREDDGRANKTKNDNPATTTTSSSSSDDGNATTSLTFYKEIAVTAKPGALVIIADVKTRSRQCLQHVMEAMSKVRSISPVYPPQNQSKQQKENGYSAEVLVFRIE